MEAIRRGDPRHTGRHSRARRRLRGARSRRLRTRSLPRRPPRRRAARRSPSGTHRRHRPGRLARDRSSARFGTACTRPHRAEGRRRLPPKPRPRCRDRSSRGPWSPPLPGRPHSRLRLEALDGAVASRTADRSLGGPVGLRVDPLPQGPLERVAPITDTVGDHVGRESSQSSSVTLSVAPWVRSNSKNSHGSIPSWAAAPDNEIRPAR
jgi:hypothetical protein